MIYNRLSGKLDFENYWGEQLSEVRISHYTSSLFDGPENYKAFATLEDVKDKSKISDAMSFSYALNDSGSLDFWSIRLTTESGKVYITAASLRCSIEASDNGKVILGVNGDSKKMYVAMVSGDCSINLLRIN